jgi:hypothetical protein
MPVLFALLIAMNYWAINHKTVRATKAERTSSAQFVLIPGGTIGMKLRYDTKPGVIAIKVNATGKIRVQLAKLHGQNFSWATEAEELEVQRMDIAKFLCDACGATDVIIRSLEGNDEVTGTITQLK